MLGSQHWVQPQLLPNPRGQHGVVAKPWAQQGLRGAHTEGSVCLSVCPQNGCSLSKP